MSRDGKSHQRERICQEMEKVIKGREVVKRPRVIGPWNMMVMFTNLKAIIIETEDVRARGRNRVGCFVDRSSNLQKPGGFGCVVSTVVCLCEYWWNSHVIIYHVIVRTSWGAQLIRSNESSTDQIGIRDSVSKYHGRITV